jgi:hypothetical protein
MAAVATCPAAFRRIRAVHVPRATAAISSRRHHPWLSPTLAARGIQSPVHLPAAGGEGEGEEKEEHRPPRSRSRPRGGAGPAGATHTCDLCLLSAAPVCFPYQRRLPPHHSAAHPFTDACTSARGHPGEDAASPPLWTPRPSSRGGTPPRRRATVSEAGHRARLGCPFLQVPLPSSTCARSLVCLRLVAVACRAVLLVTATPRHGRVHARARDRAGPTPLRPGAPQHTRTPIWGQGWALGPFSCLAVLAALPPRTGWPCRRDRRMHTRSPKGSTPRSWSP